MVIAISFRVPRKAEQSNPGVPLRQRRQRSFRGTQGTSHLAEDPRVDPAGHL